MSTTRNPFTDVKIVDETTRRAPERLISDWIPKYHAHLVAAGRADTTLRNTMGSLLKLSSDMRVLDLTADDIEVWIDRLRERDFRESTIALHLKAVKTFYKWLWRNKNIETNPFHEFTMPRRAVAETTSTGFSAHEVAKMRQAIDDIERYGKFTRATTVLEYRLVFMLALTTGMRLSEFENIRLSDFEVIDGIWWLRIPKAKWHEYGRNIRIERETSYVLVDYVKATEIRRNEVIDAETGIDDYLFVGGSRATVRGRLLNRLNEIMEISKTKSDDRGRRRQTFHAFRKTIISQAAIKGATPTEIESAYGVGAQTARKHYINPALDRAHTVASAAADQMASAALRPVEEYESNNYVPFAKTADGRRLIHARGESRAAS